MTEAIGYIGGTLLGIQLFPQVVKTWRSQSVEDISLEFLILNFVGLGFMFTYGMLKEDPPLYIPTSVSFVLTGALVTMKTLWS